MAQPPTSTGLAETRESTTASLMAGTLILDGRFRIERVLGGGGMGLVYVAEQVSLGRKVAVKVLREDLPLQAELGERFRREAVLLSSVEHPAVVRVIDYGPHGRAMCLVMEYVEGETLDTVLRREAPLSVERVERILSQLAQGLAAIHAKGIIHRDMKPDNVMLTRTAEGGEQARLLDFGIARFADPEREGTSSVTQVGLVLGTPEYVSPEQATGQPLDARSDLYSLGVIAWWMLVGHHPFPGPTPREFISQHIHQQAPPLVDAAPHLANFPSLVNAVTACLEKDAARRPQSAQALLESLTAKPLLLSTTLTGRTEQPEAPAPPKRKFPAALVAGAIALLAVVIAVMSWRNVPERRARRLVEGGRGPEALQVLDDMGEQGNTPAMQMLRGAALHQVGRHEDEWKVMAALKPGGALEPDAVRALADDYARAETPRVRKLLAALPKQEALPVLQELAQGEESWMQWGALRFVDVEYAGQGLPLLELYAKALGSKDCNIRRSAAKRLVEFRSKDAVEPLRALKDLPKKKPDDDCGQSAAEVALQKLEREFLE